MADIKYLDYSGLSKLGEIINKKFAAGISGTVSDSTITVYLNNNTASSTTSGSTSGDLFEAIDSVVIPAATSSTAGLMSKSDKAKLDGIDANAKTGTVTSVTIKAGDGITISSEDTITTSGTRTISLDAATASVLGGIKVGKVVTTAPSYTADGTGAYYKVNAASDGTAYVALPSFKTTHSAVNDPAASGNSITFIDTISQTANGQISATKKTVRTATASAVGLVKGGTTSGKTYGVAIDANGAMTVAVPWTDTLFKTATINAASSATTPDSDTVNVVSNTAVTATGTNGKSATGTFSAVSVPTKKYVDNLISGLTTDIENLSLSALEYKGTLNGSTASATYGGLTPAATKGNVYIVTTAGKVNNVAVEVGDAFVCTADSVAAATSTTYSTVQNSWTILNTNWSAENKNATLSWGNTSILATVGGVDITAKLPSNPNANTWRNITVNGTQLLGTATSTGALNFTSSGSATVSGSNKTINIDATNTTYSFTGGTNGFTVTPSVNGTAGTAQTVSVTPSITNNVTYSSAVNGKVAIFDGTTGNIKSSGFTIGCDVPAEAKFTDTNTWRQIKVNGTSQIASSSSTALNIVNGAATTATWANSSLKIDHNAPATSPEGTYGPSADVTGSNAATIKVPQLTVDAYGHVTGITEKTFTAVNTDTWRQIKVNGSSKLSSTSNTALNIIDGALTSATWSSSNLKIDHKAPATSPAGTYGPSAAANDGTTATTFNVPQITVDAYGHVTAVSNKTWTSNTYVAITEDEIKAIFGVS